MSRKDAIIIGRWIARTLFATSQLEQVNQLMNKYSVEMLGLRETRLNGKGGNTNVKRSVNHEPWKYK